MDKQRLLLTFISKIPFYAALPVKIFIPYSIPLWVPKHLIRLEPRSCLFYFGRSHSDQSSICGCWNKPLRDAILLIQQGFVVSSWRTPFNRTSIGNQQFSRFSSVATEMLSVRLRTERNLDQSSSLACALPNPEEIPKKRFSYETQRKATLIQKGSFENQMQYCRACHSQSIEGVRISHNRIRTKPLFTM